MSFSRAGIKRFNDVPSGVPSPTRYDPKSDDKGKGGIISKVGRERSISQSSDASSCGTPFKTPFSAGKQTVDASAGTPYKTPFTVKKHNCLGHTHGEHTSEKSTLSKPVFSEPGVTPISFDDALMKAQLTTMTDALNASQKLADDLRCQNEQLEQQKTELNSRITSLEKAKAEFECLLANSQNCEKQVHELTEQLAGMQERIEKITMEKESLQQKIDDGEGLLSKHEDEKIEQEKRILSLEGTLEQVRLEYTQKADEVARLVETSDKLKFANECLAGKVSSLESEVARLESEVREKEETIFGLEDKASSLTSLLEAALAEKTGHLKVLADLSEEMKLKSEACVVHETTIKAMDLEIGEKQKHIEKISTQSREKLAELQEQLTELTTRVEELTAAKELATDAAADAHAAKEQLATTLMERDTTIQLLNEKIADLQLESTETLADLNNRLETAQKELSEKEVERNLLIKAHEEEIFRLGNGWETKMLAEVQCAANAVLEKEGIIKLQELQHSKKIHALQSEFETQLRCAEEESNRRQSAQLEAGELLKDKYEARIADMESTIAHTLECKGRELAEANERYLELLTELSAQKGAMEEKIEQVNTLTSANQKLSTRLSNMLEEIKLVNRENVECEEKLAKMTDKFTEELQKNDRLSEQLGTLDTRVATISEDLKSKISDNEKLLGKMKQVENECSALKVSNLDLQLNVASNESRANKLNADLEASRSEFKRQLLGLNEELASVKGQCYKFEIALANTRNSLNEIGKRLIESEGEVERLVEENKGLRNALASSENSKNENESKCRLLLEDKNELLERLAAAENAEQVLKDQIHQLELRTCDLELTKNELKIMHDTLVEDKKGYEEAINNLKEAMNDQNLKMVHLERECLDHVDAVSQTFMGKMDEFLKTSSEKILRLKGTIEKLTKEKQNLLSEYEAKCSELDALLIDHEIARTALDVSTKENHCLNQRLDEKQQEVDKISEQLKYLSSDKEDLLSQVERLGEICDTLRAEADSRVLQIQEMKEKITSNDKRFEELNCEIAKVYETCDEKLSVLERAKAAEIEELRLSEEKYRAKLLANTDEIVSLISNLESERIRATNLEDKNKALTEKSESLEGEVRYLNNQLGNLQKNDSDKARELEKALADLTLISEECTSAKEEVFKLSNELKEAKENSEWKMKWNSLLEEKEAMATELLAMTEKKDYYKFYCQSLQKQSEEAEKERTLAVKDFEDIHAVLQQKDVTVQEMQKRIDYLESLIGPFKEQLVMYETERQMLENDREQLRKQHLDQAAKLGHQNHKQKIQHVVRLKNDILQLRAENQRLSCELKAKNKKLESLGENPKRLFKNGMRPTSTPFKGKENDEPVSPIVRVKQETMSPSNPLKERNQ